MFIDIRKKKLTERSFDKNVLNDNLSNINYSQLFYNTPQTNNFQTDTDTQ